ncbi:hypothetical protein M378DRAFT_187220 [Amanita muscaria Koide BX008]|uniref:Serine hydrolase domain-containing protein n=1 Tax=Amanita muscaria (strain Koide BX008) TaxID=946122 RepID=A0A0C2SI10_AMAMK|nr:hypothetical protein M378DRAFT_187220 [Amanita muscaria Koide BX008]
MRFLCLHGTGTNAAILRQQFISIHNQATDLGHTFEFIDGFYTSGPGAGIQHYFPDGPYYTWWPEPTVENIREACKKLREFFETNRHTPFEGILGFSRGSLLIASYLLFHNAETPHEPLPFKAAVFLCGGPVLPVLESLGVEVSPVTWDWDRRTKRALRERASVKAILKSGRDRWTTPGENGDNELNIDPFAEIDPRNVFGFDSTKLSSRLRIGIPTLHVYGKVDPRFPAAMQLLHLCDPETRLSFMHEGGHNIPKNPHAAGNIAHLLDSLARKATAAGDNTLLPN